jgi:hypothetical protein
MKLLPLFILLLISSFLILPAAAAGSAEEDMLKKAQNLNVTVPQKGDSMLGIQESMTQMVDWLNACVGAVMSFVNDVMKMPGISNTTYAHDMTKTLEQGTNLSKSMTKK